MERRRFLQGLAAAILLTVGLTAPALAHHKPEHPVPPGHSSTTTSSTTTTQPATSSSSSTTTTTSIPTTTTTVAPTTTTVPDTADATVSPGDNINAVLADAGEGATVLFSPGVYARAVILPLHRQTLVGFGAVLDGQNVTPSVISSNSGANDVTFRGFEVTGYTEEAFRRGLTQTGRGFTYDQLHVHHNLIGIAVAGVRSQQTGNTVTVSDSYFHDQTHHAIQGGGGSSGGLIVGNEFANNDQIRQTGTARGQILMTGGGAKFWTVRDNWFHDGDATGIHFDGRHEGVVIENNLVERHGRAGISFELSDTTDPDLSVIRGNTVRDSGLSGNTSGGDGAGILILGARNVLVEANDVDGVCGIVIRQTIRTDPQTNIPWHIEDVTVRSNQVHMDPGCYSGIYDTTAEQLSLTAAANNHFEFNSYTGSLVFRYGSQLLNLSEWQQIFPADG